MATTVTIEGQPFQPTARECVEALERGVVSHARHDRTNIALLHVYYRGAIYTILINVTGMTCQAARLSP